MFRWSPRRQAILWGSLGLAMLLFGLWKPWFIVDLWGFRFPLAVLLLLYAGLQLLLHVLSKRHVIITDEEIERFGKALEEATPMMLELLEKGRSVTIVAEEVQEKYDVPPGITHRYLIVLLQTLQNQEGDILVPKD